MRTKLLILFVAAAIVLSAYSSYAYAGYAPTLTSPANNSTYRVPDNLTCTWVPDQAPVHYMARWSTTADITSGLLFEYKVTLTTYNISGLPGYTRIYWRVSGVDSNGTEHHSPVWTFTTGDDNEYAGEPVNFTTKLTFDNGSPSQTGWTYYYTGTPSSSPYWSVYSTGGNYNLYYWAYQPSYGPSIGYYEMTTPVTLNGMRMTFQYDWAHYDYTSSGDTHRMYVEIKTTEDPEWKLLYDHLGDNNNYFWVGGSYYYYATVYKTQRISLSAYQGKTVYLRFKVDTGDYPYYADFLLDNIVITGDSGYAGTSRDILVSTSFGNAIPIGAVSYTYAQSVTFKMNDLYYYTDTKGRYIFNGFSGTGSIPITGTSNIVTVKMYRTSTLYWLWKRQYSISISTYNGLGAPDPDDLVWVDRDATRNFRVQNITEPGYVNGTRWRCTGFTATGDFPESSAATSVNVKVTMPGSISWQWGLQYSLKIQQDEGVPAIVGNISPAVGEYWYYSGQSQIVSSAIFSDQGDGTSFINKGWVGTGSVVGSTFPNGTVTITMPSTLTWQWDKQVFLTIISEKGQATGSPPGWYVKGDVVNLSVQSPFVESEDIRYAVTGWTSNYLTGGSVVPGNGTVIPPTALEAPTTVTWTWRIEYRVVFNANYGTVNPPIAWVPTNGEVSATAIEPETSSTEGFAWSGWTGIGPGLDPTVPSGNITRLFTGITGPTSYTAYWAAQFYLGVNAVNGSLGADYNGFYDEFAFVSVTAIPPTAGEGTRWVPSWQGTGNGSVNYPASFDAPSTVDVQILGAVQQNVTWVLQYRFQILDPTGLGHPIPPAGDYWYFNGDPVSGSVEYFNGLFICDGFIGTGSAPATSTNTFYKFNITQPSSVTFIWKNPVIAESSPWGKPRQITSAVRGHSVEMARKSDGSPFIAFQNPVSKTLEAAYAHDGAWVTETIDTVGSTMISISLVLDRFDVPYIAYRDGDDNALKFATRDAAGWSVETVDNANGSGEWVSIKIAPNGTIGIAYYVSGNGSLRYAFFTPAAGKVDDKLNWTIRTADDAGNVGNYCSLAYTLSNSEPRIAYYNSTTGALMIASWFMGNPGWTIERITGDEGDFGANTSLSLDPAGFAIICYRDNTVSVNRSGLMFARELPEGWQLYALDTQGVTGFDASMAIDGYGYPHISYNDFGSLYYAYFNGLSWIVTTVAKGDVGYDTALSLDANGNAAIAYWDGGSLFYADVTANKYTGEIINRYTDTGIVAVVEKLGGGGCFIATAAFSTMNAKSVESLCSVRDKALGLSTLGGSLIAAYYAVSPDIASAVEVSSSIRSLLRVVLEK